MKVLMLMLAFTLVGAETTQAATQDCALKIQELFKNDYRRVRLHDENGQGLKGFAGGRYEEGQTLAVSLVLETTDTQYFYTESCDICAELIACPTTQNQATFYKTEHSLSCADLPTVPRDQIYYSACL